MRGVFCKSGGKEKCPVIGECIETAKIGGIQNLW